ncbi:MAG: hypothetical protein VB087_09365 [Candidatus Limiplasma sp.]|nr:hypothetical protein [Candidatus Limiplasma sp.]
MGKQRKGAVKGLIVFLGVMAALTFFSQTIYYNTLPKVEVQRVSSGVLQTVVSGSDILLYAEQAERVDIPADLADLKLRVERVWVQKTASIKQGEALLRFDPAQGASTLAKAERMFQRAEEALTTWDIKYQNTWNELDIDMLTLQRKMAETDADPETLGAQLQTLQAKQEALERTNILDGVSRASLEQNLSLSKATLATLTKLSTQGWVVNAPNSGVVSEILVKEGDEYSGLLPLVWLVPASAKLRVGIECKPEVHISSLDRVMVYSGDDVPLGNEAIWAFAGEGTLNGKRVLWAEPTITSPDLTKLTKLNFRIDSDYCQYMVPNAAVVEDTLYVLDSRQGAWGTEELFARRVEGKGVQSDDKNTSVSLGLTSMDNVIIKWDRPFEDGDTVMIPLR